MAPRRWIERDPCLPPTTYPGYSRKALRSCLIDRALSVPKPRRGRPVAILTMGGPGSGKSTMIAEVMKGRDFVRSDPDEIKAELPEYALAVSKRARNAAAMVHEESSSVAREIARRAIRARKNLIIDGTGANLSRYEKAIGQLQRAGYHVTVIGAALPPAVAKKRVSARAQETGRFVPAPAIDAIYRRVPCNFLPIAQVADEFALFDTRPRTPRLIMAKKQARPVQILDRAYLGRLTARCDAKDRRGALSGASRTGRSTSPAVALASLIQRIRR